MFEVCITYYDSPREDCSGYYYDVLEVPTAKEAWFIAKHINREDEPKAASVDLKSGKPRRYKIFINDVLRVNTIHWNEFQDRMKDYRELVHAAKKGGVNTTLTFSIL